jgi:hypothetical protein
MVLLAAVALLPFAFIGAGGWLLYQGEVGPHVLATVNGCETHVSGRSSSEYCTGTWQLDGRTVEGDIENADDPFPGETIEVTVHGDTAYTRSLTLPVILIGLGLPFLITPIKWARAALRRRQDRRTGSESTP